MLNENGLERPIYRASGQETEDMERVVANLTPYLGKDMFIRITDQQAGPWGHINFDDFVFYDQEPNFPKPAGPKAVVENLLPLDNVKFAGLPPEQAAKEMRLPPGSK